MINMCKLKLTNLQQEILRLLYIKMGKSLNQRQIAKELEVSAPAVKKALPELEEKNFIKKKKDKDTKRLSIKINRENHKVMQLKRVENLSLIYESGLYEYLEEKFAGTTIILFGSYAKGEDTINSDIDIAIIGRNKKDLNLGEYENILSREIILNFYKSFKNIHKELKENLLNGIILTGAIEL